MTEEVEQEFKALFREKISYREKRKYVRREIKKARKRIDRDWKHLPNRILRAILGGRLYNHLKESVKA